MGTAGPLLGVLDEAANGCRWRELPNLYSHYGSRGIILMTIHLACTSSRPARRSA